MSTLKPFISCTPGCLRWGCSHKDPALTVRKRRMAECADVPGSYSKAMVQTAKGATKNPWLVHMRKCAEEYRKEQEAKAAPKKHLRTKTSPEMSDNESEAKPAPKRRLRAKTSPGEMPVAEPQPRRRLTKKTPDPAAIRERMVPPEAASPAPAPKRRPTKKTPTSLP